MINEKKYGERVFVRECKYEREGGRKRIKQISREQGSVRKKRERGRGRGNDANKSVYSFLPSKQPAVIGL